MSSQEKETVLCPNKENESIAEVSKKQPLLQKEDDLSILRPRLFETFEMSKISDVELCGIPNHEIPCFEQCKSVNTGSKPTNFSEKTKISNEKNSDQQIHLEIGVSNDRDMDIDDYKNVFSWMFENEITDESWPHIQHFFSHLLEPHGTIKYVSLVPFDMKIWKDLVISDQNVVSRICAVQLQIEFELYEFDWVINFASRYCSAKTLEWWLESTNVENSLILTKECLDTIGGFIGSQADNFNKLEISGMCSFNIDELAVAIVKMFQGHEDPSKMIKKILLELRDENVAQYKMKQKSKEFPFCLDEQDIYTRTYKNQNSDYVLKTRQSFENDWRTIQFTVLEPTSQ